MGAEATSTGKVEPQRPPQLSALIEGKNITFTGDLATLISEIHWSSLDNPAIRHSAWAALKNGKGVKETNRRYAQAVEGVNMGLERMGIKTRVAVGWKRIYEDEPSREVVFMTAPIQLLYGSTHDSGQPEAAGSETTKQSNEQLIDTPLPVLREMHAAKPKELRPVFLPALRIEDVSDYDAMMLYDYLYERAQTRRSVDRGSMASFFVKQFGIDFKSARSRVLAALRKIGKQLSSLDEPFEIGKESVGKDTFYRLRPLSREPAPANGRKQAVPDELLFPAEPDPNTSDSLDEVSREENNGHGTFEEPEGFPQRSEVPEEPETESVPEEAVATEPLHPRVAQILGSPLESVLRLCLNSTNDNAVGILDVIAAFQLKPNPQTTREDIKSEIERVNNEVLKDTGVSIEFQKQYGIYVRGGFVWLKIEGIEGVITFDQLLEMLSRDPKPAADKRIIVSGVSDATDPHELSPKKASPEEPQGLENFRVSLLPKRQHKKLEQKLRPVAPRVMPPLEPPNTPLYRPYASEREAIPPIIVSHDTHHTLVIIGNKGIKLPFGQMRELLLAVKGQEGKELTVSDLQRLTGLGAEVAVRNFRGLCELFQKEGSPNAMEIRGNKQFQRFRINASVLIS